jgi:hypothetical protein
MPVRKVRSTGSNIIGHIGVAPSSSRVHFESTLERDFFIMLRFDIHVESFEEQPVTIHYKDDTGKERKYTPDVLVRYRRDIKAARDLPWLLCEVKYTDDLKKRADEYAPKFAAGRQYAGEQGWEFEIFDETRIRTPYLENARFLYPYRDQRIPYEYKQLLLDKIVELRLTTPDALLTSVYRDLINRARLIPALWVLITQKHIGVDLTQKLTMQSPIWSMPEE